jgi:hypothetical protein
MHTLQAYLNERAMLGEDKRKAQRLRAIRQQYAEVSLFKRLTEETDEKVVKRLESEYTLAKRERDTEYEKMKDSKMANALLSMESKLGRATKKW